ncbi:hypothetical protein GCM10007874_17620 [Labrys miyagiensis]|uniref:DUF4304 domain-containing protein n=1 Tax=Labrys miyagiensis TaxID=346912 RepID=A0ABQ6CIQ2_9HYPH|nr:hypothetical protein [Labrys miyagiensis]GLS18745.1 hypothetical protein GCM10007874_17620 [Labrys miyagiensis]
MREYVKSKEFNKRMRLLLTPKFQKMGWTPKPGNRCVFKRGVREFWLQTSKYNNSLSGGKFTINLGTRRILAHLNENDREIGREVESRLVARWPRPDPDPEVEVVDENGGRKRMKLGDTIKPNPRSWDHIGSEVWLRYLTKEDLDDWATFLEPRLSRLILAPHFNGFIATCLIEAFDPFLWIERAQRLRQMFRAK